MVLRKAAKYSQPISISPPGSSGDTRSTTLARDKCERSILMGKISTRLRILLPLPGIPAHASLLPVSSSAGVLDGLSKKAVNHPHKLLRPLNTCLNQLVRPRTLLRASIRISSGLHVQTDKNRPP